MAKKITIKNPRAKKADEWVSSREGTQRVTFDMPASLHAELKAKCAQEYKKIKDVFIEAAEKYIKGK